MKTLALLAILVLASCAAPHPSWNAFNPLDEPGAEQPTVEDLHAKNVSAITGDPTRTLR